MGRIVYRLETANGPRGGHKMALRHVEVLRKSGIEAYVNVSGDGTDADWIGGAAPSIRDHEILETDVLVVGEGSCSLAPEIVGHAVDVVVFCQNHFAAAARGFGALAHRERSKPFKLMTSSDTISRWAARFVSNAIVTKVPAFVDGSVFFPREKAKNIACLPGKRPESFHAVVNMLRTMYSGSEAWNMLTLHNVPEAKISETLGEACVYLSLSRREGLGLSTLEAMSSGCVIAGFTGIGGDEYASPNNGFWVREDDDEACAEALSKAMALVDRCPEAVRQMVRNATETSRRYGAAAFEQRLLDFWRQDLG